MPALDYVSQMTGILIALALADFFTSVLFPVAATCAALFGIGAGIHLLRGPQ